MTVIYKTIDLKHKFHKKINNLQTLKLSKLILIIFINSIQQQIQIILQNLEK
jgi:hypothetical protein